MPVHRNGVAAKIEVDVVLDLEAAQDPFAVRRALAGHGRLRDAGRVDRGERLAGAGEQARRGDDGLVVDRAVLGPAGVRVLVREIRPGEPEHRVERQPGHPPDGVEVELGSAAARDDRVRRVDDEAQAVGERAVEVPTDEIERARCL